MENPGGIIPEELMHFEKRKEAFKYVLALPMHGQDKVNLWIWWGHWCACKTSAKERATLEGSSV